MIWECAVNRELLTWCASHGVQETYVSIEEIYSGACPVMLRPYKSVFGLCK